MIERPYYLAAIDSAFKSQKVVAFLGPRQCGKTTLARNYSLSKRAAFFDLEDVTDLAKLEAPKLALEPLEGLVIIDEIQRRPDLFPTLRVLADRPKSKARFLILGSASRELIKQSSETLAGRIQYIELTPFSLFEVDNVKRLWERGGFPKSFLAQSAGQSWKWRESFVRTFLEQDIPQLGIRIPSQTLRRFWTMLAHYHGQTFNASEIGRSLQITDKPMQRYLDILTGTFMIRQLQPWHENLGKRQVKSPKIYFRDSGLFHYLMGLPHIKSLQSHPKLGASWEGFALESVIRESHDDPLNFYFWATQGHSELDLFWIQGSKRVGFEFKYTDAPKVTKSMEIAIQDLGLSKIWVIIPGKHQFKLRPKIQVLGLENISSAFT